MSKRTKVDFSNHKLVIEEYPGVLIHKFRRPDTGVHNLVFINTCGILAVTGDFGNWVFCREFHPSTDSDDVSDGYWDEKLQIASEQKAKKYDSEYTKELIKEFKKNFPHNYGNGSHDYVIDDEVKDWFESLEQNVDDEIEYTYIAYRDKPNYIDYEDIPFGVKRHAWLNAVYDGFEAICEYLKNQIK